jgi:hypothetical protein
MITVGGRPDLDASTGRAKATNKAATPTSISEFLMKVFMTDE